MNSNNLNATEKDNDIKFVPLNLKEPFSPKNQNWFPIINSEMRTYNDINVNMLNNFSPQDFGLGLNSNLITLPPMSVLPKDEFLSKENDSNLLLNDDKRYSNNSFEDSDIAQSLIRNSHCNHNNSDPIHMDLLRNLDFSLEDFNAYRGDSNTEIDTLFKKITKNNPSILTALKAYGIPYPMAALIIKQTIKLSLKNCENNK